PPVRHGLAVQGARHRAVHRPLRDDLGPRPRHHHRAGRAVVALLRETDPAVQERPLDDGSGACRDPRRPGVPGAGRTTLTVATARAHHTWAQPTAQEADLSGPQVSAAAASSSIGPAAYTHQPRRASYRR